MDKRIVVKIKMAADWWEEIVKLYDDIVEKYQPKGDHELLLHGHAAEMAAKLRVKLYIDRGSHTIAFGGTESLAFLQSWHGNKLPAHPLQQVLILEMIAAFDKARKIRKTPTIWIK